MVGTSTPACRAVLGYRHPHEGDPASVGLRDAQVHERPAVRVKDPPEGKQEKYGGRRRYEQMTPEPELVAERGAERADARDIHSQVDEHHREPDGSGEISERARAAVVERAG